MIIKAKEIDKRKRLDMDNPLRGIYASDDYDPLAAVMARYPSAVATLETALSLHGITDDYLKPPFFLSFNLGYRPIKDEQIAQIWEDKKTRVLGTITMERDGVEFLVYDKERLLLELLRREKLVALEAYSAAISYYRKAANDGTLNLPKLREYCKALPKGGLYRARIRKEIL